MRERIEEINIMRGLAIFGIVLLHVSAYFLSTANAGFTVFKVGLTLNQLVRFSLPMFLMISGFGLAYNFDKKVAFGPFIVRRLKSVFVPYVVWSLIYFLFYIFYLKKIPVGIKVTGLESVNFDWTATVLIFLKNLLFGWNYVHLYFVVLIFQIYPFTINRITKIKNLRLALGIGFILYLLLMIYLFYFRKLTGNIFLDIFVKYYWEMFVSWYFYFLFGLVAGIRFDEFRIFAERNFTIISLGYFVTSLLVVAEAFLTEPANIGKLTSLRVTVLLNTVPAILFYFKLSQVIKRLMPRVFRFFRSLGDLSFGVYFVHLMILAVASGELAKAMPKLFSFNRTLFLMVLFIATLAGSIAFVKITEKLPLRGLLNGKK